MKDQEKTREQLVSELGKLRQRVAELGAFEAERRRAEKALRDNEERYRALSHASFEAIFISEKGICIDTNQTATEMFGYDYDELVGIFGTDVIAPESKELVNHYMLSGYEEPYEAIAQRKDGTTFQVEVRGKMTEYKGRSVRVTVVHDIDKSKKMEEKLRESEEKYREIFELSPEAIVLLDRKGNILDVNARSHDWLGYSPEEVVGKNFLDLPFLSKEGKSKAMAKLSQRMAGNKVSPYELGFYTKSGEKRIGRIVANPIQDENGEVIQDLVMISDITERKQAEEALRDRIQELTFLNRLARQVSSTLSLDQAVKNALNGIVSTVKLDLALLYSREGDRLILADLRSENIDFFRDKAQIHKIGSCLCGLAASEGRSVFSRNLQADPRCTLNECKEAGLQSFAALPLIGQDETIGVLGLASTRDRDFEQQATFLESVTKLVSIALQNASLYEKVQLYTLQLEENIVELRKAESALREREAKLEEQSNHLEQVNAALNVLLNKREEDKSALEESVVVNVKELILPYLEKLKKSELQREQMTLITILESHLKDIVSPFTVKLSTRFVKLTATEIKIANLVKDGSTNKDIAAMLDLSENTVKNHRSQIRNKLGLKHKKINLRSYLRSLE